MLALTDFLTLPLKYLAMAAAAVLLNATAARRLAQSAETRGWLEQNEVWPDTQEEYGLAHFGMLAILLIPTMLLDWCSHKIQRRLLPDDHHATRADFSRQLHLILWSRLQGELTVVGTLVVTIWLSYETHLADGLAAFSASWQDEHLSGNATDDLFGGVRPDPIAAPTAFLQWLFTCHPRMPRDPESLLHLAQDVHVALFVTKLGYFGFLWLALQVRAEGRAGAHDNSASRPRIPPARPVRPHPPPVPSRPPGT